MRVSTQAGKGTRFQLQLPVTLSVVRTLLVDIAGEPYAFPLAYIVRTLKLSKDKIELLEGRQHFEFEGRHIGLVTARQVFAADAPAAAGDDLIRTMLAALGAAARRDNATATMSS